MDRASFIHAGVSNFSHKVTIKHRLVSKHAGPKRAKRDPRRRKREVTK
jgi:hypothetical protein